MRRSETRCRRPRNADVLRELAKVYAAIAELNLAVDRLRQQP
jgi:hypothetical protein